MYDYASMLKENISCETKVHKIIHGESSLVGNTFDPN